MRNGHEINREFARRRIGDELRRRGLTSHEVSLMAQPAWAELMRSLGERTRSSTTKELVVEWMRAAERNATRQPADPFEGFPVL